MTKKYKVEFCHENIPEMMEELVDTLYAEFRNRAAKVFNAHISAVNEAWSKTGKSAGYNNPEYMAFIRDRIQPKIDEVVDIDGLEINLGENCDLEGHFTDIPGSKVYVRLYEVK